MTFNISIIINETKKLTRKIEANKMKVGNEANETNKTTE